MKTLPADAENLKKSRESQVESLHTPTVIDFIAEIDRMIDSDKPRTHLWNYCVWHRKAVLREMVRHDMSIRKVLAHHELMPGRVAANTEDLMRDLTAVSEAAADKAKIKALVEALETVMLAVNSGDGKAKAAAYANALLVLATA